MYDPPPIEVLRHWLVEAAAATIHPIASGGFSGAKLWRVEHAGRQFALRRWPDGGPSPCKLVAIHALQAHLAVEGLPVAAPMHTPGGCAVVSIGRASWTLVDWLHGEASYWQAPSRARLAAVLAAVAEIHISAAKMKVADPKYQPRIAPSPALRHRQERLAAHVTGGFYQLQSAVRRHGDADQASLALEALSLVDRTASPHLPDALRWRAVHLPLQWCLRDVWHDHVLFTDDRVTGVIDFGAASIDSPAGDVARLLGSLVGDDEEAWKRGLEAYELVRPLSGLDREAVAFFDASGTIISAINWVNWLFRDSSTLAPTVDRSAAFARLERLVARLQTLARRGSVLQN